MGRNANVCTGAVRESFTCLIQLEPCHLTPLDLQFCLPSSATSPAPLHLSHRAHVYSHHNVQHRDPGSHRPLWRVHSLVRLPGTPSSTLRSARSPDCRRAFLTFVLSAALIGKTESYDTGESFVRATHATRATCADGRSSDQDTSASVSELLLIQVFSIGCAHKIIKLLQGER